MPKVAWAEMERNLSADEIPLARSYETGADSLFVPLRIPRIIHHLYDGTLMEDQDAMLSYQHWQRANPGWELRFYDVADMRYYVERWLPEYVATFDALPFDSGKRDFFGYLTILHHGGIFAHASAKCPQPLNRVLQSWDAMVVVWDREWSTAEAALERCYVRRKQLQHRIFAAVPGHPLLKAIVEQVSSSWTSSSKAEGPFDDDVLEWMERVGAGLFTRLALDYASGNPPSKDRRAWSLRILPREMLGAPLVQNCLVDPVSGSLNEYLDETVDGDDTTANHSDAHRAEQKPDSPSSADGWSTASWRYQKRRYNDMLELHEEEQLFPVSADFDPPFEVMVHLSGHGEIHSGWDVSSELSGYGSWQASIDPVRRPTLSDALIGSMGLFQAQKDVYIRPRFYGAEAYSSKETAELESQNSFLTEPGILVDVGAGYGYFSLAAAARGHQVHAFEIGAKSLSALNASIDRNGFEGRIHLHPVVLGPSSEHNSSICVKLDLAELVTSSMPRDGDDYDDKKEEEEEKGGNDVAEGNEAKMDSYATTLTTRNRLSLSQGSLTNLERGYGSIDLHNIVGPVCTERRERYAAYDILPKDMPISALRIAVNGWAGHVLEGFVPLLQRHPPQVISIEWNALAMKSSGYEDPLKLIRILAELGYSEVSHSGFLCDERWFAITYGIRQREGFFADTDRGKTYTLRQPTWCRLLPEDYGILTNDIAVESPETVLFVRRSEPWRADATHKGSKN